MVRIIEQPADPLVGGVNIILGDIVPDAIQIPIGIINRWGLGVNREFTGLRVDGP
jgi:hypothetical protein